MIRSSLGFMRCGTTFLTVVTSGGQGEDRQVPENSPLHRQDRRGGTLQKDRLRGVREIEPKGEGHLVRLILRRIVPNDLLAKLAFAIIGTTPHNRQAALGLYALKAKLERR